MNKNDENIVRIMIEAAEEALSFVAGKSRRNLDLADTYSTSTSLKKALPQNSIK